VPLKCTILQLSTPYTDHIPSNTKPAEPNHPEFPSYEIATVSMLHGYSRQRCTIGCF